MPLWTRNSNTSGAPKWNSILGGGAGSNATGANLYANATVGSFVNNQSVGMFTINSSSSNDTNYHQLPGWNLIRHGTGPITTVTATSGSGFANGETFVITGTGAVNATGTLTTNATGNLVSGAITDGGAGFANVAGATVAFNREKHLTAITVSGTPTGYSNTDVIVAANGTVNALATVSTNSTGGFVSANVTITNVGLWANTKTNGQVSFTVLAANGSASAGTGATFAATLGTSTAGTVTVTGLGGRANRISYEPIVAMRSVSGNASVTLPTR